GKRSEPHLISGRRLSFGECFTRLVLESRERELSHSMLWWLSEYLDYSLDWLFFGAGTIAKSSFHDTFDPSGSLLNLALAAGADGSDDASLDGTLSVLQTVSEIKAMRGTTTWRGADWNWLMNGKTHTAHQCKSPTLPLCARCVSAWNIQPVMPEMPDLLAFIDWLYVYILREFFMLAPLPKSDWRQQVFAAISHGKNKVLLLLGTTAQAGTQYRLGKAMPGSAVVKLAYFLELIIRRFGRDGFLQYIAMVNEEARARGFANLLEVMERKSWRDDRKAGLGEDFDAEDLEGVEAGEETGAAGDFAGAAAGAVAGDGSDAGPGEDAWQNAPKAAEAGGTPAVKISWSRRKKKAIEDLLFDGPEKGDDGDGDGEGGEDAAEASAAMTDGQAMAAAGRQAETARPATPARSRKGAKHAQEAANAQHAQDVQNAQDAQNANDGNDANDAKPAASAKGAVRKKAARAGEAQEQADQPAGKRAGKAPRKGAGSKAAEDTSERDAQQRPELDAEQKPEPDAGLSQQPPARRRRPAPLAGFLRRRGKARD
ncbi:MAG: hypothetical protein J5863_09530, partial [Desulfovibrio sp.]|nr:hypothetical protein [Desulfovibrio sp.]